MKVFLNVSFQYSIANFGGKLLSWQKKLPRFREIKLKLCTSSSKCAILLLSEWY